MALSGKRTSDTTYAIIGSGITGITAAEVLRMEDPTASIVVVTEETTPTYYRPALKDYLAGRIHEDKLWARPTRFYQNQNIPFLVDRVVGIQAQQHLLELQSGQYLGYQKLLLAQGARASRLSCKGTNLRGVVTLRSIPDYREVERQLSTVQQIVVTGGGTLALETIETLRHRGFKVVHLLRRNTLWSEVLDNTASDLVLQQERRDGVDIRLGEEIAEISGKDGVVSGVLTTSGSYIPCELVICAIGIDPIIDFVQRSGIPCGRGIKVDTQMRTTAQDIYAAGDVLETVDSITGRSRLIGQWYPAIQQARAAVYSMLGLLGTNQIFDSSTCYNASFLYGLDFASVGITTLGQNGNGFQVIVADPQPRNYRKVVLKNGVIVGGLALGERSEVMAYKRAIDHRVNLSSIASWLFAPDFHLDAWLDKQGVPNPMLVAGRKTKAVTEAPQTQSMETVSLDAILLKEAKSTGQTLSTRSDQNLTELMKNLPATATSRLQKLPGLVVVRDGTSEVFYLDIPASPNGQAKKQLRIGREQTNDITLTDMSVSRQHAELVSSFNNFYIRDLNSSNGVLVNETRITQPYKLTHGDQIMIGGITCYFLMPQPKIPSSASVCPNCGTSIVNPSARYCRSCGAQLAAMPQEVR